MVIVIHIESNRFKQYGSFNI